ncbi:MAG TPA: GNAT family N-acetyltransferase [Kofleriaceae bacterium]|nr:GNAT family N-acetyltransferase [Kofleriaceae bacterium]
MRIVEEADLAIVISTFPEKGAAPENRHLAQFRLQQEGAVTCLVAWDGATPVGYVHVRWPGDDGGLSSQALTLGCPELGDLFVAEHARGRGIGRTLVETAESIVASRGFPQVGLEVAATNPNTAVARALYERLGYRDAGFGDFISGYTYWDATGAPHRDEELYRYLVKQLDELNQDRRRRSDEPSGVLS